MIAGEYITHYCPPEQAGSGWEDPSKRPSMTLLYKLIGCVVSSISSLCFRCFGYEDSRSKGEISHSQTLATCLLAASITSEPIAIGLEVFGLTFDSQYP